MADRLIYVDYNRIFLSELKTIRSQLNWLCKRLLHIEKMLLKEKNGTK